MRTNHPLDACRTLASEDRREGEWEDLGSAAARLLAGLEMRSPKPHRPMQMKPNSGRLCVTLASTSNAVTPRTIERRFRVVGLSSSSRADGEGGERHRPVR